MSVGYASEKLLAAVRTLATSPDSIQDRLFFAWLSCHTLTNRTSGHVFPTPDLAEKFYAWSNSLSQREPVGDEGTIKATTSKMTDAEASNAAQTLWEIFYEVEEAYIISEYKKRPS